jgi:hypothetical protein
MLKWIIKGSSPASRCVISLGKISQEKGITLVDGWEAVFQYIEMGGS